MFHRARTDCIIAEVISPGVLRNVQSMYYSVLHTGILDMGMWHGWNGTSFYSVLSTPGVWGMEYWVGSS